MQAVLLRPNEPRQESDDRGMNGRGERLCAKNSPCQQGASKGGPDVASMLPIRCYCLLLIAGVGMQVTRQIMNGVVIYSREEHSKTTLRERGDTFKLKLRIMRYT